MLRVELTYLKSVVNKQTHELASLKKQLTEQKARSMQSNVLFHNVPEERTGECETLVTKLLQSVKYKDTYKIDRAHRVGPYVAGERYPRPIVVKMALQSEADGLLRFAATKQRQTER